jgi:hypothetical protein
MFRFQKRNGKELMNLKGSEFRTVISLVSFGGFWKGGDEDHFFGPMNNFFQNFRDIHPIVTGASCARLKN